MKGVQEIRELGEAVGRLARVCDLTQQCVPVRPSDLALALNDGRERSALASRGVNLACAVEAYFAGECVRDRLEALARDLLSR